MHIYRAHPDVSVLGDYLEVPGLGFLPVTREPYDLVVAAQEAEGPRLAPLWALLRSGGRRVFGPILAVASVTVAAAVVAWAKAPSSVTRSSRADRPAGSGSGAFTAAIASSSRSSLPGQRR